MPEQRVNLNSIFAFENPRQDEEFRSAQDRELHRFISAVDELILSSSSTHFLTEIWLGELARIGSKSSLDWRSVSLAASERLVKLVLDSQLRHPRM